MSAYSIDEFLEQGGIIRCSNQDELRSALEFLRDRSCFDMDEYCSSVLDGEEDEAHYFMNPGLLVLTEDDIENEDEHVGDKLIVCYSDSYASPLWLSFRECMEMFSGAVPEEEATQSDVSSLVSMMFGEV